jgi:hypothetical protein
MRSLDPIEFSQLRDAAHPTPTQADVDAWVYEKYSPEEVAAHDRLLRRGLVREVVLADEDACDGEATFAVITPLGRIALACHEAALVIGGATRRG